MEVGDPKLAGVVVSSGAGPHQLFAIWRKDGQYVSRGSSRDTFCAALGLELPVLNLIAE